MSDSILTLITIATENQEFFKRLELNITELTIRIEHIERVMDKISGKKTKRNIIKALEQKEINLEQKIMPEKDSPDYYLLEKLTKERKEKEREKEEKKKLEKLAKYEEMKKEINREKMQEIKKE